MRATLPLLLDTDFPPLARRRIETVQANLGHACNQTCLHCHVNAGPTRTESMTAETVAQLLEFLAASGARALDLTGGAPELNPHFRDLVRRARPLGARVIARCNLTILEEPGQEDLAPFLAGQGVEIVASLPCYTEELVDRQRGKGVYGRAVTGSVPWVSIMCKFSDIAAEPKTLAYFQGMYDSTFPGLDHFWREVSYNNANVVVSAAHGWFTLPQPRSYYITGDPAIANLTALFNDCTGVFAGSGGGTYRSTYEFFPLLTQAAGDMVVFGRELEMTLDPMWLLRQLPNNVLCHVGIRYGFRGTNACITNQGVGGAMAERGLRKLSIGHP